MIYKVKMESNYQDSEWEICVFRKEMNPETQSILKSCFSQKFFVHDPHPFITINIIFYSVYYYKNET